MQKADNQLVLASGLQMLLAPLVLECDAHVTTVSKAQAELCQQIELFTVELDKIRQIEVLPWVEYAQRIQALRASLDRVHNNLQQVTARVDRLSLLAALPRKSAALASASSAEPAAQATAPPQVKVLP